MKPGKLISNRLKGLREAAGLSQQDVAMRAELSLSLVAKLEQGKKADPRASTLLALARALDIKPGAILDDLGPVPVEEKAAGSNGEETPVAGPGKAKKKGKKQKKK